MLRDKLRNKSYFDEAIKDVDNSIARYLLRLDQPEKLKPYGRMGGAAGLCRLMQDRIEYRYSRGDALVELKQDLVDLLKYRELQKKYADALPEEEMDRRVEWERLDFSTYKKTFMWLSFAVSLEANQEYLMKLLQLVDNEGLDIIYDRIAVMLGDTNRPVADKVLYKIPYKAILDAIESNPSQQAELMNKFLDDWYPACVKQGFYETHEITNNFGYRGYWCYEAALIVKLFGIDDTGFRDHRYYPADLVHTR